MSNKCPTDLQDHDKFTISEIDRYADYESDSEEYSSGDRYKPSEDEKSSDENYCIDGSTLF